MLGTYEGDFCSRRRASVQKVCFLGAYCQRSEARTPASGRLKPVSQAYRCGKVCHPRNHYCYRPLSHYRLRDDF
jgi:hypothetical protein